MGARTCGAVLAIVALLSGTGPGEAQDSLKIAVPQRGAWDTGVAEVGQRGGIFKRRGLVLELLYTQGGPNRSRRSSPAAWIWLSGLASPRHSQPMPRARRSALLAAR